MVDETLKQYAQSRCPQAFRSLVDQHGRSVYAQCVRQLRDPALAEDVTQAVFMVLARKAPKLPEDVVLPAWLFQVTRYACANAVRGEIRRKRRELEAAMMQHHLQPRKADARGNELEIALDDALSRLGRADREAVILRYYSGMSAAEVGTRLGVSADAAKRRLSRALVKLRAVLSRRGVVLPAAAMVASLDGLTSAYSMPPSLSGQIAAHAMNAAAVSPYCATITEGVIHMMRWTQIKLMGAAAMVLIGVGAAGVAVSQAVQKPAIEAAAAITPEAQAFEGEQIRGTLDRIAKAIRSNDREALETCIQVADGAAGELARAMMHDNLAVRHLQNAWASKFQSPMTFSDLSFVWFPEVDGGSEVMLEIILANIDDSDIRIAGTTARVPMKFDREQQAVPRGQRPFPQWQGAWIALVRDGAFWKVDLSNTMHIPVVMTFLPGQQPNTSDEEILIAAAVKRDLAEALHRAAGAIDAGELALAAEASRFVEAETGKVFAKHRIAGINYNIISAKPLSLEFGK